MTNWKSAVGKDTRPCRHGKASDWVLSTVGRHSKRFKKENDMISFICLKITQDAVCKWTGAVVLIVGAPDQQQYHQETSYKRKF